MIVHQHNAVCFHGSYGDCPWCGRCPNCGRGAYPYGAYPWYPHYPWVAPQPVYPHWNQGITYTINTNTTVTAHDPVRSAINALAGRKAA